MNKSLLAMLAAALMAAGNAFGQLVLVEDFSDLLYWQGSGSKEAALVIQFNGLHTPVALAWGFRWDGDLTLEDMMFAIAGSISGGPAPLAGSDARLSLTVQDFGFGYFVDVATYNQHGLTDWSQVSQSLPGWDGTNWNNLFFLEATSAWPATAFDLADEGMSDLEIVDGGWYAWVHADGPQTFSFARPYSAIPEPSAGILLLASAAVLAWMRRRRG